MFWLVVRLGALMVGLGLSAYVDKPGASLVIGFVLGATSLWFYRRAGVLR